MWPAKAKAECILTRPEDRAAPWACRNLRALASCTSQEPVRDCARDCADLSCGGLAGVRYRVLCCAVPCRAVPCRAMPCRAVRGCCGVLRVSCSLCCFDAHSASTIHSRHSQCAYKTQQTPLAEAACEMLCGALHGFLILTTVGVDSMSTPSIDAYAGHVQADTHLVSC